MHSPLQSPLQPVMRSPLEFRRRGGGSFDIASTNPSVYYDRTNLATLFQAWTGVVPVTSAAQTIGLGLDLSQGATVGADALSHPLSGPQNGGWSLSGETIVRSGAGGNSSIDFSAPQDVNSIYLVEFDVSGFSGDSFSIQTPQGSVGAISANGHYEFRIRAIDDTRMQFIPWAGTAATAVISNISAKVIAGNHQLQATAGKRPIADGSPIYANFDAVDDDLVAVFPASLGAGCTVCRSLPGTGASITTGVTLTATYTDNVDAHALLIYTAAQWAALDAGQIAKITTWLDGRAGL